MRSFVALTFALAACGSPKKAPLPGPGVDVAKDTCCCKSNPLTSEDGQPVFAQGNRMECSTQQGECVDDVQCISSEQPE